MIESLRMLAMGCDLLAPSMQAHDPTLRRAELLAPTGEWPSSSCSPSASLTIEPYVSRCIRELKAGTTTSPTHRAEARGPGPSLGRYRVRGELGHGGMGTVFEAYDPMLDRSVAIKVLHPEAELRHAYRLMREARALARISHPNVVHVYEAGQQEDHWYVAMELVRGPTLRHWQQTRGWRECVATYVQIGEGLAAVHAAGLVHRDFKPDNCIIDAHGSPKVLDFGLARDLQGSPHEPPYGLSGAGHPSFAELGACSTRTGTVMGTLGYMPLEQLSGKPADARSDQFSFCVALYEALYGERPFTTESLGQLTLAMMSDDVRPPPPGTTVPDELRQVLLRGLSAEPERRWATMGALLQELRRLAEGDPARARSQSAGVEARAEPG